MESPSHNPQTSSDCRSWPSKPHWSLPLIFVPWPAALLTPPSPSSQSPTAWHCPLLSIFLMASKALCPALFCTQQSQASQSPTVIAPCPISPDPPLAYPAYSTSALAAELAAVPLMHITLPNLHAWHIPFPVPEIKIPASQILKSFFWTHLKYYLPSEHPLLQAEFIHLFTNAFLHY